MKSAIETVIGKKISNISIIIEWVIVLITTSVAFKSISIFVGVSESSRRVAFLFIIVFICFFYSRILTKRSGKFIKW